MKREKMESFLEDKYRRCGEWIAEWITKNQETYASEDAMYDAIAHLEMVDDDFDDALEGLIDNAGFPDDLEQEIWERYVAFYRKRHKRIEVRSVGITDAPSGATYSISDSKTSAWKAYERSLAGKMSDESIANIAVSSRWTLNQLSLDTRESGPVKGLVTGSVQSGKTANMEGLITMAADQDFNFFILLSGTIENLRMQTQTRLQKDLKNTAGITWKFLDFPNEDKHFSESNLKLNVLGKHDYAARYVTVCLKNKSRLVKLLKWLYSDPNVASRLRIVVIDDEADQASPNTCKIQDSEEEQERKAINQQIIYLVHGLNEEGDEPKDTGFEAINYVSYTATPYANVLNESGPYSLYPRNFIYALEEPKEYFGASVIFGNMESGRPGLDMVNTIPPEDAKLLKKADALKDLPKSLKEAAGWFLDSAALLRHRKVKKNISMLVHTSSSVESQYLVYEALRHWLAGNPEEVLEICQNTWEAEWDRLTKESIHEANPDYGFLEGIAPITETFADITPDIEKMLREITNIKWDEGSKGSLVYGPGIHMCLDNSRAVQYTSNPDEDTLRIVYPTDDELKAMDEAPVFIVVGGNTLSRGLTIEGLVCTYFSRDSNQADSLMQMGRWFGYRKGIELLQRIWLTEAEEEKFKAMAKMDKELKNEIERFMTQHLTPAEFGPKVYTMPEIAKFKLTAANKMQKATAADFNFEGYNGELTDYEDGEGLKDNIACTKEFIDSISQTHAFEVSDFTGAKSYVWRNVDYADVKNTFLTGRFQLSDKSSLKADLPCLVKWLDEKVETGKYKSWNVAIVNGPDASEPWPVANGKISWSAIHRTKKLRVTDHIDIGSLRSGTDVLCDVEPSKANAERLQQAIKSKKDLVLKRSGLGLMDVPLLLLYRIKKDGGKETKQRAVVGTAYDLVGFAIIISGLELGKDHTSFVRVEKSIS